MVGHVGVSVAEIPMDCPMPSRGGGERVSMVEGATISQEGGRTVATKEAGCEACVVDDGTSGERGVASTWRGRRAAKRVCGSLTDDFRALVDRLVLGGATTRGNHRGQYAILRSAMGSGAERCSDLDGGAGQAAC